MSILKYIDRLKHMDSLLRRNATGTPERFAKRLGISKSTLYDNLKEVKELGAKIGYCKYLETYYYEDNCELFFSFKSNNLTESETNKIKGGFNRTNRRTFQTPIIQECGVLNLECCFSNAC